LRDVCCSPRLAERFASAGVRRAHALFPWDRVAHSLAGVYAGLRRSAPVPEVAAPAPEPLRSVAAA
jgi:hypothetical protein